MKIQWIALYLMTFLLPSLSSANSMLICQFNMFGAPFLKTITELTETQEIGPTTLASLLGSPDRLVYNKVLFNPEELYTFQLEEGAPEDNITIHVTPELIGTAVNPKSPIASNASGPCSITNRTL